MTKSLLEKDPSKRPTIQDILQNSLIKKRIKNFLSESIRVNEFSHTILHKKKFV